MKQHIDSNKNRPDKSPEQSREGKTDPITDDTSEDYAAEFEVIEKQEDDREFVGGKKGFSVHQDELGTELSAEPAEKDLESAEAIAPHQDEMGIIQPIGQSTPSLLAEVDDDQSADDAPQGNQSAPIQTVKKLSPEEVKEIERTLYGADRQLVDPEKKDENRKTSAMEREPGDSINVATEKRGQSDITPETKPDLPPPVMAKPDKGIAYFYRNYIQVLGRHEFFAGDLLQIGNRTYELMPKRFNRKVFLATAVVLSALVLFLIGSQFVSDTATGNGEIIGMVLDENGQPYVRGATITFAELGRSVKSNSQGFFRSGPIPKGSHKIEYRVDGKVIKVDYATVVSDKITMLSLRPDEQQLAAVKPKKPQYKKESSAEITQPSSAPVKPFAATSAGSKTTSRKDSPKATEVKTKGKSSAKITLAANVENARFELDGSVLGAGNLTYSQINPGTHKYSVSKVGYQPVSGTIKLSPGEKKTLAVELPPLEESQKEKIYTEEDYYYSGLSAMKEMDLEGAIADFSKAIEKLPSYAEAYSARAEAYSLIREKKLAHDDYIRAAEIYQIRKDLNKAITAYNKAIELDKKSVTAYLGRANTYLRKGEEIAAIADYKAVVKYDKRNPQGYLGLGEARFRQGQYSTAVKHFRDARSLDSDNPLIYQYLMLCYLAMDDIKKVKKSFEKFEDVATDEQMARFRSDPKFSAVLRVVEND
ncbi:MAG: tetratricopeptide repeat protein [bacterium]